MIVELADTMCTVLAAAILWAGAFGAAAALVVVAVIAAGVPLGVWDASGRALTAVCGGLRARAAALRGPVHAGRPVPSWAHTEPYDYDEAA